MDLSADRFLGVERKWWVLVAVGVGTFMSALDGSVTNIIIPVLKGYFNASVPTLEWIVTIYLLVVSGLLLSFGRLGDLRGHKGIYLSGFLLFILGSGLCGLAPTVHLLVAFRALQALGAAMLFANSPAILTGNFPPRQRGQALGMQATMTYLGLTVGPSLGGWLTDHVGWRAVFYINIPVGLIAFLLSLYFIPPEQRIPHPEPFDIPGALTFMTGLVAILLGLNQGNDLGWGSLPIIGLFGLGVLLLSVFIYLELHRPNPMLDLSLFRNQLFSAATASALINYICLYMIVFLMPFYLLQGRSLTTSYAGLLLTAQPLIMAVVAPISGTLSDRIGSRFLSTLGLGIMVIGLFILSRLGSVSPVGLILLGLAVFGLGTGIFISPNNNALMSSAPSNRQGIAAGILATARNSGMVIGVGLAGALFTTIQSSTASQGSAQSLFTSISTSFLVASGISLLGVIISASRGRPPAASSRPTIDETSHAD